MKVVASYPAYDIIDMEQDIIDWPSTKQEMAIAYTSRSHGVMYNMYSVNGVANYVRECNANSAPQYHSDPEAAVERAKANGHALYWINSNSVSITAWERPKTTPILVTPGQKIRFDGKVFEVVHQRDIYYNLVEVK